MEGGGSGAAAYAVRSPEEVFRDHRARRAGMIKALTTGTRASPPDWASELRGFVRLTGFPCAVQMWTSSSSSATPVSALDLFGYLVWDGDWLPRRVPCSRCLGLVALVGDWKLNSEKKIASLSLSLSLSPILVALCAGIRIIGGRVAFVAAVLNFGCWILVRDRDSALQFYFGSGGGRFFCVAWNCGSSPSVRLLLAL
jgi:hypothetical protein